MVQIYIWIRTKRQTCFLKHYFKLKVARNGFFHRKLKIDLYLYNFCNYVRQQKVEVVRLWNFYVPKLTKIVGFRRFLLRTQEKLEKPLKGQELPMSRGRVIRVQSVQTTTGGGGGVMLTRGIPPSRKCKTWLPLPTSTTHRLSLQSQPDHRCLPYLRVPLARSK